VSPLLLLLLLLINDDEFEVDVALATGDGFDRFFGQIGGCVS